jgi:DNA repair exonuclease SbcCD ATPase subunit
MSSERALDPDVRVRARNIGGIDEAEVALSPGVSVLAGRNATNRTSFLQSIMAGLGSDRPSLKGDADEGEVELRIDDETYTRTVTRNGETVSFGGDPYLEDATVADQFAFLLEDTEIRRAVERGDDLREIIMQPVDTERIEAEISQLQAEKRDLEDRIDELERLEADLPDLEAEKADIEADLEAARADLADVEGDIDAHDVSLEQSRAQQAAMEERFDELRAARSELETLEFDLETERQSLEELQSERDALQERLDGFDDAAADPEQLADRIEELRDRKRSLDDTVSELGSVISFNEEMVDGDGLDLDRSDDSSDPTSKLVADEAVVCWTCGSEVEQDRIESTVDRLRDLRAAKLEERNDVGDRIDELVEQRSGIQQRRRERDQAERRLDDVEAEIATAERRIEDLEASLADQGETVERLEAETAAGTGEDYDEVLELHRRANELELRIENLEDDLTDVETDIADHEDAVDELAAVTARREEIIDELTDLRTRVDRIEEDAVEAFNDHMASVLSVLEYDNIERIWIERREREVQQGRRKVDRMVFDLHIVRATDNGTTYRDTVDHLSESEREVTGLVFALAGYLVYEVYEELPFMVLDSLEAIDSDRIARVIEYFGEYADYLVVALLPEDAQALSAEYTYVEQID